MQNKKFWSTSGMSLTKIAGSGAEPDPLVTGVDPSDPDPYQNFMDLQHFRIPQPCFLHIKTKLEK
jgi:hypothetical protein